MAAPNPKRKLARESSEPQNGVWKRRAPKLLSPLKVCNELGAIRTTNSTKSPLLRLPPEIRTTIWELVLGGRVITLNAPDRERSYACFCDADSCFRRATEMKSRVSQEILSPKADGCVFGTVCGPRESINRALTLSLLHTCRQIHEEAALIPFTANTFSLDSCCELWTLLRRPLECQVKHITTLNIRQERQRLFEDEVDPLRRLVQSRLTGLKNLISVDSMYGDEIDELCGRELIHLFAGLPLRRVVVATVVVGWESGTPPKLQRPVSFRKWAKLEAWEGEVEHRLLADVEDVGSQDA